MRQGRTAPGYQRKLGGHSGCLPKPSLRQRRGVLPGESILMARRSIPRGATRLRATSGGQPRWVFSGMPPRRACLIFRGTSIRGQAAPTSLIPIGQVTDEKILIGRRFAGWCAAARGATICTARARPSASTPIPAPGTTSTVFGLWGSSLLSSSGLCSLRSLISESSDSDRARPASGVWTFTSRPIRKDSPVCHSERSVAKRRITVFDRLPRRTGDAWLR